MDEIATALRILEATPAVLASLIEAVPAGAVAPSSDGPWNVADVVAHLILTGRMGALARIRTIVAEDDPSLLNNDEDAELRASGLRSIAVAANLRTFTAERTRDIAWGRELDAVAFARTGRHSVAGTVSAAEFLQHAAYHDCLHIAQISAMLQAHFEPLRGPMRVF